MSPPCPSFDVSELPARVQQGVDGRRRKLDGGARRIELSACELFKMNQFECDLKDPADPHSAIACWPVTRFFRMCKDRKGSFAVETTAWEASASSASSSPSTTPKQNPTFQWTNSWQDS